MNIKLATGVFIIGSLLAPLAVHAEDTDADRAHPMTFVKDSVITTKVKAKLAAEKIKSLAHVKVDTDSAGMVVLSGKVRTQEEADKAVSIAQGTEGVTSVTSHLRVVKHKDDTDADRKHPMTFVKDSVITTKVKAKLAAEKMKSLTHIKVDTDSAGMVVLRGKVGTQEEADKAVSIAQGTEGVTSVTSHLRVVKHKDDADADRKHPMTFVKDSVITTKVKAKLAAEKIKSLAHVKVDTDSAGMVVLSGKVATQEEADKAVSIAQGTEGVTSVTSHLRVVKHK